MLCGVSPYNLIVHVCPVERPSLKTAQKDSVGNYKQFINVPALVMVLKIVLQLEWNSHNNICGYIFKKSERTGTLVEGEGGRKCVEHEPTDRNSFSRPKKEKKKKIPGDTKLILVRFSVVSY